MQGSLRNKYLELLEEMNKLNEFLTVMYFDKHYLGIHLDHFELDELENLEKRVDTLIWDIQSYIFDYVVELQNAFFSKTFNYKVSCRKPNNPRYQVLVADDKLEL